MKTLIVLRHGKAEHHSAGQTDFQRALAPRGLGDSERVGALLAEKNLVPDAIVSSSAKRAHMTAECVADASGFAGEIAFTEAIYEAGLARLLSVVREIDEAANVALIVGHNPGFWSLTETLAEPVAQFPTCAWSQIEIDVEHWGEVTELSRGELIELFHVRFGLDERTQTLADQLVIVSDNNSNHGGMPSISRFLRLACTDRGQHY